MHHRTCLAVLDVALVAVLDHPPAPFVLREDRSQQPLRVAEREARLPSEAATTTVWARGAASGPATAAAASAAVSVVLPLPRAIVSADSWLRITP